jgi:hypothetical protein
VGRHGLYSGHYSRVFVAPENAQNTETKHQSVAVPILLLALPALTNSTYSSHGVLQGLNPQHQLLIASDYHSATSAVGWIKVCQQHCKYYRDHRKQYRRRHLQEQLEAAKEEENEEAERQILGIIKRECKCGFWRRVKYVMGIQHGGSVRSVQVEDEEGNIEVFSTREEVHKAIWSNIHRK